MDSFTHVLTGAVIAKAIDDEKLGNWGIMAGLATGFFPDTDFVLGLFNRQFYLEYHRDFTHSLLLIPFYALFFSWVFVKISRRHHFWSFYKICLPVLVSHVILDLLTSYGTMIFSPISEHRYSWDLVFIVDLIFSGIICFPLGGSFLWKRKSQWICRGSLAALSLYIVFCWVQHHRAIELAKVYAKDLKEDVIRVASLPQPLSPFRWANYVETNDKVYQGFVDLLAKEPPQPVPGNSYFSRLKGIYWPPQEIRYKSWQRFDDSPWVERALATEGVKFYYWFARFPVVKSINSADGKHRVEFIDVRFLLPGRIRTPFVYYVEFDDSGKVRSEGFVEDRTIGSRRD